MGTLSVRIDEELVGAARAAAKAEFRSVQGQLEFWAKVGRAALDNPDLPASFIAESLMSLAEIMGPPLFMWFYYNFKTSVPNSKLGLGTPFLVAAFIALLAFLLISWTLKGYVKIDEAAEEE